MELYPDGKWTIYDMQQFSMSVSAIYNYFFIVNHYEEHTGIKDMFTRKQNYEYSNDPINFLNELNEYMTISEKLIIKRLEMGSPDFVQLSSEDVTTRDDTSDYLTQMQVDGEYIDDRAKSIEVDERTRNFLRDGLNKATTMFMRLLFRNKLKRKKDKSE